MQYTADALDAPFRHFPFVHQLREFEEHAGASARALLWQMRTGKSKAVIDKACFLYENFEIDGVLIFAPNGVHSNWILRELPAHVWEGVETETVIWQSSVASAKAGAKVSAADRAQWAADQAAWWERLKELRDNRSLFFMAVNTESMTRKDVRAAVARFMKQRRVFVVFDESDDWGVPGSIRTKMARAVANRAAVKVILSGTALHSSPLAAFSQFELLEKGALGFTTYGDFKNYFAEYKMETTRTGQQYPKLIGYKHLEDLRARMARFCSVVTRDEVKDMPALHYEECHVALSPAQRKAYKDLHESFVLEIDGEELSVGERAQRLMKLQQVCSGFVIDEAGRVHDIPGAIPRLEALREEVFLAPGKVIIWCQFQHDIDLVVSSLSMDGHDVVQYHGRVSDVEKAKALRRFREEKGVKAIVGHIQSGGRGLDMSAADVILNYSHSFKARLRAQAEERATKIGGANIRVIDIIAPGPDSYILKTTRERREVADAIAGSGLRDLLEGVAI